MKDAFVKTLFLLGAIIIVVVLIFSITRLFKAGAEGTFGGGDDGEKSSLFSFLDRDDSDFVIKPSKSDVNSTEPISVSWDTPELIDGVFRVTHSCVDDVQIDIQTPDGIKTLVCETPFTLDKRVNRIDIIPILKRPNSFDDVEIVVSYVEEESDMPEMIGKESITIRNTDEVATDAESQDGENNEENQSEDSDDNPYGRPTYGAYTDTSNDSSANNASETNTSSTSQGGDGVVSVSNPNENAPVYSGPADLEIINLAANGNGVTFTVTNIGGEYSGLWKFSYTTPTSGKKSFNSPSQVSLAPGQSTGLRVDFRESDSGSHNIKISIDSTNAVSESNEGNNEASINLSTGKTSLSSYTYRTTSVAPRSTSSYTPTSSTSGSSLADLTVTKLDAGKISSGDSFVVDSTIDSRDDAAIRFIVRNGGKSASGVWRYRIDVSGTSDDFESGLQTSLGAGESSTIVIELGDLDDRRYDIEVQADSSNSVSESNERNNYRSTSLRVD